MKQTIDFVKYNYCLQNEQRNIQHKIAFFKKEQKKIKPLRFDQSIFR